MTKVVLADCRNGTVVLVGERWGVLCGGFRNRTLVVDFWDGGREYVAARVVVEVQA